MDVPTMERLQIIHFSYGSALSIAFNGNKCYHSAKIVKNNVKVSGINTVQISAKVKGKALGEIFGQLGLGDLFSFQIQ